MTFRLTLLLSVVLLAACTFWANKPNDPETVAYVDWVSSDLIATDDPKFYADQAAPELLDKFSAAKFVKMSKLVKQTLGQFIEYHSATGTTRFYNRPVDGVTEAGQYQSSADFAHGTATIDVFVQKINGKWKLYAYYVNMKFD